MKTICKAFILIVPYFFIAFFGYAQEHFSISGIVSDEKGEAIKAATVFISGSKKITITNEEGKFSFTYLVPGSYQLVVKMLGYIPVTQNVIIQQQSIENNIILKPKQFVLEEVVIGSNSHWEENYNLFKNNFLGTSKNAKQSKILNPKILNFNYNKKKGILKASTDEFLIIENKSLGYQIKYLLKTFEYNAQTATTIYDGETSFEDLKGSNKVEKNWIANRSVAYHGSLMHFLRSVYHNTALQEGFLAHQVYTEKTEKTFETIKRANIDVNQTSYKKTLSINSKPVRFDTLVYIVDTAFVSLKFISGLYVTYNTPRLFKKTINDTTSTEREVIFKKRESILQLYLKEALIDNKGSVADYRTFLIKGYWGAKRIGDQLPFEYVPQHITSSHENLYQNRR